MNNEISSRLDYRDGVPKQLISIVYSGRYVHVDVFIDSYSESRIQVVTTLRIESGSPRIERDSFHPSR